MLHKRFSTLLIACLTACSLVILAGCSSQQSSSSTTGNQGSTSTTPEQSTATASTTESQINLAILYEQDDSMINNYSLLAVNPNAPFVDADGNAVSGVKINTTGAKALIDWMLSSEGMDLIKNYGYDKYNEYLFYLKDDAPKSTAAIPKAADDTKTIRISTTTSVNDSGLLDYLLPTFEKEYGYTVEVYSAGTGKALANATYGNADLLLVHSKTQEEDFVSKGFSMVEDGYSKERLTFMYNYFVLCGPKDDPAGVAGASDVKAAFKLIADGGYTFVSRGDGSGTHTKEVSLWPEELGITTDASSVEKYPWYNFSNAGMGTCLTMANEMDAYILSDKATFLTFQANGGVVQ